MKVRKLFLIAGLIAVCTLTGGDLTVLAHESPPGTAQILGPEIWGVIVLNLATDEATLRVKRIKNCVVYTEAHYLPVTLLQEPDDASDPLWFKFSGLTLFADDPDSGIPPGTVPIITQVKNFKRQDNYLFQGTPISIVSFDAQIKFCQGCP